MITTFLSSLSDEKKARYAIAVSLAMLIILGFIDFHSGYELSFFIFYIFPVAVAAWFVGKAFGFFMSVLSIVVWFYADIASGHVYSAEWIIYWNAGVRLIFFTIDTLLLSALKRRLDFEKEWARVDGLTGALNGRGFRERLEHIMPLAARSKTPFAMAYIDLDNFKKVNDTKGHAVGDLILQASVKTMIKTLRATDFVGRMGGDEFAIFLPDTNKSGAENVLKNLHRQLLKEVDSKGWPIGFSMGAVTLDPKETDVPHHQQVIQQADALMYEIKHGGKNDLAIEGYKV